MSNLFAVVGIVAIIGGVQRLFGTDVALILGGLIAVWVAYLIHKAGE